MHEKRGQVDDKNKPAYQKQPHEGDENKRRKCIRNHHKLPC